MENRQKIRLKNRLKSELKPTAFILDVSALFAIGVLYVRFTFDIPLLSIGASIGFFVYAVIYLVASHLILGKTLGKFLAQNNSHALSMATLFAFVISYGYSNWVKGHPSIRQAEYLEIAAVNPGKIPEVDKKLWNLLPFYYAIGLWPREVDSEPVIYSLPYRKGPPFQFPEKIHLKLKSPGVRLTLEGPKTPDIKLERRDVRDCFEALHGSRACTKIKYQTLSRHLTDMQEFLNLGQWPDWTVSWFEVNNPQLNADERPQGVYIRATGDRWTQERYILVNSAGNHQTVILTARNDLGFERYSTLARTSIATLKVFDDLAVNRAWINNELASTKVGEVSKTGNPYHDINPLVDAISRLISKISVDPKDFDAYFHLGGTSYLLNHYVKYFGQANIAQTNVTRAFDVWASEWNVVGKPLLNAAYQYSKDINPTERRLSSLEKIYLESKKEKN